MGENRRTLEEIMNVYPQQPRFLLPILQDIQKEEKYLSSDAMRAVAKYLGLPDSRVYAVATFYKVLSLVPKGEHEIKLCTGTACHLRGASAILAALEKELGIRNGETTDDGKYSIECVNCVGACALAPVTVFNGKYHGKLKPQDIAGILDEFRQSVRGDTGE
ncbi:MAG: NAD(P)H-dependent oxidoreductase subunit E [Synergistaceae bacterium]|nr:NAD(P)H-dependent oxidoreductase subunit E [Synergistaceae bacterium]